jgi:hypothetical protein
LPWKEASAEAVNAVAFASSYHKEWFWSGVGEELGMQWPKAIRVTIRNGPGERLGDVVLTCLKRS